MMSQPPDRNLRPLLYDMTLGSRANGAGRSVLFINRVYPPAPGATGELLADFAAQLVADGWRVTILTASYPGESSVCITKTGVVVRRVRGFHFTSDSFIKRLLSYLSLYPALFWESLRIPRHDIVVTKTDPPLQAVLGPVVGAVKGSKTIHWLQDLYPEIAEAVGVLHHNGFVSRLARRTSSFALSRHDQIVAIGRCMRDRLVERGLGESSITVIPNWPATSEPPIPHECNQFRREHDLQDRFVVMYSGNMGLAHPFEALLEAAQTIQNVLPEVLFLFVGGGPRLTWIQQQCRQRRIANVRFLPSQPKSRLSEVLSAADLHVVTMQEYASGYVVPSKIYGALAAGRPCLFLGPESSEAARVIRENQCGHVLSSNDGTAIADTIMRWYAQDAERYEAGQRAQKAVSNARIESFRRFESIMGVLAGGVVTQKQTPVPVEE